MWEGTSDWFHCYSLYPRCYGTQQDNFEWPQRWICSKTYSDFGTNFCQTYGSCHERKTEATLFILFRAMTVITSTSDRPNVSLVHVWKSIKKRSSFAKRKFSVIGAHNPNQPYRQDKCKIITTKSGISTPPTFLEVVKSWRLFTLFQKKGQLISERIKGSLVLASRSPLMKALDRSVETLGLWIVTSRLHSSNLQTRIALNHVWLSTWLSCEL